MAGQHGSYWVDGCTWQRGQTPWPQTGAAPGVNQIRSGSGRYGLRCRGRGGNAAGGGENRFNSEVPSHDSDGHRYCPQRQDSSHTTSRPLLSRATSKPD
eukprot:scaffold345607_cov35-Prasinocladus_malaysianus.AAC.1